MSYLNEQANKFRMRGETMTRIETFVAAAFAFSITMLVISLGSIPSSFAEFMFAVKQIPSFAASCAIIFWIWHSHADWCRRYGLEDGITIVLSGLLIFLVLIYIYPLRLMMQGMFYTFSNGYFPVEMNFSNADEVRFMFGFYATGFILLCCNFIAFYIHAGKKQNQLDLNRYERFDTDTDVILWTVTASVCSLSLLGVLILPNNLLGFCGFIYFLLFPSLTTTGVLRGKRRRLLDASQAQT